MSNTTQTMTGAVIFFDQILFASEIKEIREIRPKPVGRVRLRIRQGEFPVVYVRNGGTITCHNIAEMRTHWELLPAHETNATIT